MKRILNKLETAGRTLPPHLSGLGAFSPMTLAAIAAFTIGSLFSSCGPTIRDGEAPQTPGGTVIEDGNAALFANNAATFSVTGNTGSFTFPSTGSAPITTVDSDLRVRIAPGPLQTIAPPPGTAYSGWAPTYSCVGFNLQLIRVKADGTSENAGGAVYVSPLKQGSGSTFCDAQAGSLNRTTAPTAIVVSFKSSIDPTAAGYRIQISGAVNDYKYQSCLVSCAMDYYSCKGWDNPTSWSQLAQPATTRCARYGLGPVYPTHRVQGQVGIAINNQ